MTNQSMFGHSENNPCHMPHPIRVAWSPRWPGRPRQPMEKGVRMIVRPTRDRSQRKHTAAGISQGTRHCVPDIGSGIRQPP